MTEERRWYTGMFSTEDWWSCWIGLFFVFVGILASATMLDLTGWIVKFSKWTSLTKAFIPAHKGLVSPITSIILSYIIFSVSTCIGAKFMKWNVKKYFVAWTIIFWLTIIFYIIGQNAYIVATSLQRAKYGINWSLSLGGAYYIIALIVGLIVGNFAPKRFRNYLKEAAKPEWFIKIAIVCLGAKLGVKSIEATGFTFHLLITGGCATIAAYLFFWPITYLIARKIFKLTREWAATLSSGASICGVSAAIATAGAIKARPIVPVMVSSLVVLYAVIQLTVYPFVLNTFLFHEPMVAGSSLGLTVKTDGADAAAGAILDEIMRSKVAQTIGTKWEEGWILASSIMTKIWIDMFIGIWAFVLAIIWVYYIDKKPGVKVLKSEIWFRFPKFVLGYFIAWFLIVFLGLTNIIPPESLKFGIKPIEGAMRKLFFMLTFTSIGIVTDFSELKKEGLGKAALCYGVSTLLIIFPLGIFIAWLFHHGMVPPVVKP